VKHGGEVLADVTPRRAFLVKPFQAAHELRDKGVHNHQYLIKKKKNYKTSVREMNRCKSCVFRRS
jgi:hypothetical protein